MPSNNHLQQSNKLSLNLNAPNNQYCWSYVRQNHQPARTIQTSLRQRQIIRANHRLHIVQNDQKRRIYMLQLLIKRIKSAHPWRHLLLGMEDIEIEATLSEYEKELLQKKNNSCD